MNGMCESDKVFYLMSHHLKSMPAILRPLYLYLSCADMFTCWNMDNGMD